MSTEYGDRLKAARQHAGLSQVELSKLTGIAQSTISTAERIGRGSTDTTLFAKVCRVDSHWLATGEGSMTAGVREPEPTYKFHEVGKPTPKPDKSEFILIPQYDTGGAMGHGLVLQGFAGVIHSMEVSREWVRANLRQATKPENLCVVTGFGDSMRGMYNPGDPLIVDTGVKAVDFDGVYFFRVGNEGFIKRLQRVPGEGLIAISENKAYRDWTIRADMDFEIFGRVLKAWKSEDF